MKDTKLINLLKNFSKDEIELFKKFTDSPFFNSVKNHSRLLGELTKFYPDFENTRLTSEYIHKKLFREKAFNKQVIWNLCSGLEKLGLEFLAHNALKKNKPNKYILLFEEIQNRNTGRLFYTELDAMKKMMNETHISRDGFYYLRVLEEGWISYWQRYKGLQNTFAGNVFNSAELTVLEFISKLYIKMEDASFYKRLYNKESKDSLFGDIIKSIDFKKISVASKKSSSKNAKLIEFFCNVILCSAESNNEEHFPKVRDYLFSNHTLFEINEKRDLVTILENYCLTKVREGSTGYRTQLFEIHQFRISSGVLPYDNGILNKMLYTQITNNAIVLGKTTWVRDFIRENTPLLVKEHRVTMEALANASLSFKLKKYEKVLEYLNKVDFIDTRDKVIVKNLMARTLFEMKEYELLLSHIDSSRHFLRNNEGVSDSYRESYSSFYHYLHRIILMKDKKENTEGLAVKIKREKSLSHKEWLLEKIAQ